MCKSWLVSPFICSALFAGSASAETNRNYDTPYCGEIEAPPRFAGANPGRRACPNAIARSYLPKYKGIARTALDLENEACFVPDATYQLLDEIIDEVRLRVTDEGLRPNVNASQAVLKKISAITGDVLEDKGFQLEIPTDTKTL
ncbi:hypothetical protein GCM10011349_47080 [Novosphingobium indicum]|uniref:Uncharacterized protein n=1 Tax=Novosphingobium indicum TaxID=462949 RepID=A0ABQ2K3P3_9SPHN|nr:hypothetical protein [Novosphingobium indicum]GGN62945.1 hypothetical protein GCM10011349_47080 [Novosphingobium indicum]